jgi:hypothetical protein
MHDVQLGGIFHQGLLPELAEKLMSTNNCMSNRPLTEVVSLLNEKNCAAKRRRVLNGANEHVGRNQRQSTTITKQRLCAAAHAENVESGGAQVTPTTGGIAFKSRGVRNYLHLTVDQLRLLKAGMCFGCRQVGHVQINCPLRPLPGAGPKPKTNVVPVTIAVARNRKAECRPQCARGTDDVE